jgi:hypothetical protein
MSRQIQTKVNLASLIDSLGSRDGLIRQKARRSLVALGPPATGALIRALHESSMDQVRWEAAKALGEIGDVAAIPALIEALEDEDSDVVWLAAEALQHLRQAAWPALLQILVERGARSASLRQAAHHVFHGQREEGFEDLIATLLKALEPGALTEMVPTAAHAVLEKMNAPAPEDGSPECRGGKAAKRRP